MDILQVVRVSGPSLIPKLSLFARNNLSFSYTQREFENEAMIYVCNMSTCINMKLHVTLKLVSHPCVVRVY